MSNDYYFKLGNEHHWNRDCDPIGIDLMAEFLKRHKDKVLEITIKLEDVVVEDSEYRVSTSDGVEWVFLNKITFGDCGD